ncbi:sugar phosphate isomerase/epimerase family protein [Aeromonas rivipollensis]|uniref:sugar phosphate isomerase/epimerase family protein n=1 Tax=Aeromonas rivipollensis TaxID=948519 RepID=UPI003D19FAA4
MNVIQARKILDRHASLPLYLHAYSYHMNMRLEQILPADLLDIAHQQGLHGVKIHILDGESRSLKHMRDDELAVFRCKAVRLGLDINLEISSSAPAEIDEAVIIAEKIGATSLRFYPRYEGHLSTVLARIRDDLAHIRQQHGHRALSFTIEQHEDLKSVELVQLVQESGIDSLSLLFDFGNMINANEQPLEALHIMAPLIAHVHIKDAKIIPEGTGLGHIACASGSGDMPFEELLKQLICLGEEVPQVLAYGLEEEVDYYAPAFRFSDEGNDPWIPWRDMSETPLPAPELLSARLEQEKRDAICQIEHVRTVLKKLVAQAETILN